MKRTLPNLEARAAGRAISGNQSLVFHCNYYNYFLQKTLLLDESLRMDAVIHDAAYACAYEHVASGAQALGLDEPERRLTLAEDIFAELGFGLIQLKGALGGQDVITKMSHYGICLRGPAGADFLKPQTHFDAGFAAGALDAAEGKEAHTREGKIVACQSMGAKEGILRITSRDSRRPMTAPPAAPAHAHPLPEPNTNTNVSESEILAALATLNFSGNEEGLLPRFGVMLTRHYANFYNRISFEFLKRMDEGGLRKAAEDLLTEAGFRCAFHTFGGIMTSGEWDAVVKPQCKTQEDWVHGMVACVNALGWGVWRVTELVPGKRIVVQGHDDYESLGYAAMYGKSNGPVSFLMAGGVGGLMNLVYVGDIARKPILDAKEYARVFDSPERFRSTVTKCAAQGANVTEIVSER